MESPANGGRALAGDDARRSGGLGMTGAGGRYDAVIVGGGHNGLVAACYLARAGFSVCVLERYHEVGGAAFTEEINPGFRVSTGSYVLSLMPRQILDELDLWAAGLHLPATRASSCRSRTAVRSPGGATPPLHDEIARFSKKDADNFADYEAFIERACEVMDQFILRRTAQRRPSSRPSSAAPPTSTSSRSDPRLRRRRRRVLLRERADAGGRRRALGLIGTFRGPRDAGTAYVKLYHSMGMVTGESRAPGPTSAARWARSRRRSTAWRRSRGDDPHGRRGREVADP